MDPAVRGGASYSWTETETTTNSEGETETETNFYTNRGGFDGATGPRGRSQTATLTDGSPANDGRVTFYVNDESGGSIRYDERYFLALKSYDVVTENGDGIIEPGEKVFVRRIEVENVGGMPLPYSVPVIVFLRDSEYLISQGIELNPPLGLAPGESYIFDDLDLEFEVRKNILAPGEERSLVTERLDPEARMGRVNVPMNEFDAPRLIDITFPIEIEPIQSLHGLAPGEASRFRFKITNISGRDFGTQSELQRAIDFQVQRNGGSIPESQVHFYDLNGKELPLNLGILETISELKAGESRVYEGVVALDPDVESYNPAFVGTQLMLESVHTPGDVPLIQHRNFRIRAIESYFHAPGSDFLLVTNEALEREAFQAWQDLFDSYGTSADIWDLSYYNFIGFVKKQGDPETGTSLLEDFRGKTVIFLTNFFSDSEKQAEIENYLQRDQIMEALMEYDIRFYFLGENNKLDLWDSFLSPEPSETEPRALYESGADLARALVRPTARESLFPEPGSYVNGFVSAEKYLWRLGRTAPERRVIEAEAQSMINQMTTVQPDQNYVVVHEYKPQVDFRVPGFFGFLNRWDMGTIRVLSRPDTNKDIGIHAVVGLEAMNDPKFILGSQNRINILLSMDFERLAALYGRQLTRLGSEDHGNEDYGSGDQGPEGQGSEEQGVEEQVSEEDNLQQLRLTEQAILISLIEEQTRLRTKILRRGLDESDLDRVLSKLNAFVEVGKAQLHRDSHSEGVESVIRLVSFMKFHNEKMNSFFSALLFPYQTRSRWIGSYTSERLEIILQQFFGYRKRSWPFLVFGEGQNSDGEAEQKNYSHSAVYQMVKNQRTVFEQRFRDHRSRNGDMGRQEALASLERTMGLDGATLFRGQGEVLSSEEFRDRNLRRSRNAVRSSENEQRAQERRRDLRVDHPGIYQRVSQIGSKPEGGPPGLNIPCGEAFLPKE